MLTCSMPTCAISLAGCYLDNLSLRSNEESQHRSFLDWVVSVSVTVIDDVGGLNRSVNRSMNRSMSMRIHVDTETVEIVETVETSKAQRG